MRTAYRCRAYPDAEQQAVLNRTFGCIRVVWNRTLAARHERYRIKGKGMSYAESDRALTAMKKDPDLAFLSKVSSVRSSRRSATSTPPLPRSSPDGHATRGSSPVAAGSRPPTRAARSG
jgi:transposase